MFEQIHKDVDLTNKNMLNKCPAKKIFNITGKESLESVSNKNMLNKCQAKNIFNITRKESVESALQC